MVPKIKLRRHPETGKLIPEIWKDVNGFEGYYRVSNYGRISSLPRNGTVKEERLLIQVPGKIKGKEYLRVCLSVSDQHYHRTVHQLVAIAFIPNPNNLPQVNHVTGIKTMNHAIDLEWSTSSDNLKHAYKIGIKSSEGEKHSQHRLTWLQVGVIREAIAAGHSKTQIAKYFKVGWRHIYSIHYNEKWII